jgi:hypothetical protein
MEDDVTKLDSPLPREGSEGGHHGASVWLPWVAAIAGLMGAAAGLITAIKA